MSGARPDARRCGTCCQSPRGNSVVARVYRRPARPPTMGREGGYAAGGTEQNRKGPGGGRRSPSTQLGTSSAIQTQALCACIRIGHTPLPFRMRSTLVPVTLRTWGMPSESRRRTPICDGVRPFFDSLQILSQTSCDSDLHQLAFPRRYGMAEADIPFPLLCMRPMAAAAAATAAATTAS
eukprot:COSAG02_NODE_1047_length_14982_cov_4.007929_6_plen_180_part_00